MQSFSKRIFLLLLVISVLPSVAQNEPQSLEKEVRNNKRSLRTKAAIALVAAGVLAICANIYTSKPQVHTKIIPYTEKGPEITKDFPSKLQLIIPKTTLLEEKKLQKDPTYPIQEEQFIDFLQDALQKYPIYHEQVPTLSCFIAATKCATSQQCSGVLKKLHDAETEENKIINKYMHTDYKTLDRTSHQVLWSEYQKARQELKSLEDGVEFVRKHEDRLFKIVGEKEQKRLDQEYEIARQREAEEEKRRKKQEQFMFNLEKPIYEAVRQAGSNLDTYPELKAVCTRYAPSAEIIQRLATGDITGFYKKGRDFSRLRNAKRLENFMKQKEFKYLGVAHKYIAQDEHGNWNIYAQSITPDPEGCNLTPEVFHELALVAEETGFTDWGLGSFSNLIMDEKTKKMTFIDTEDASFGGALRYSYEGLPRYCRKNFFLNLAKLTGEWGYLTQDTAKFANERLQTLDEKECVTITDQKFLDPEGIDFTKAQEQFRAVKKTCKKVYDETYKTVYPDTSSS